MKRTVVLLFAGVVALAGCSPPPVPDVTYFRLPPPAPLPRADKPLTVLPIEIDSFNAEGIYAEQALIYSVASGALRAYHYQLWSVPPTRILERRLIEMLRDAGVSPLVTDRLPASTQALRIQGAIRRFERVREGDAFKVVVRLEIRVEQEEREPMIEREYAAEVPAADKTIESTVAAFGSAVDQVFAKFYHDLVGLHGDSHAR